MRALTVLILLFCSGCVWESTPPPPYPVAVPQAAPPQAAAPQGCREFDTPITINGQEQQAHGTACLQPDGSWKVVQNVPDQPQQVYEVPPQVYQPYYPPAYAADPWYYGPPLFLGGVFVGGGWGDHHDHGGWHGSWHGGHH
jgi:hypothetical protein